jgi:hypothetical protein
VALHEGFISRFFGLAKIEILLLVVVQGHSDTWNQNSTS